MFCCFPDCFWGGVQAELLSHASLDSSNVDPGASPGWGAVFLFDTMVEVFLRHGSELRPQWDHVRWGVEGELGFRLIHQGTFAGEFVGFHVAPYTTVPLDPHNFCRVAAVPHPRGDALEQFWVLRVHPALVLPFLQVCC